LLHRWSADGLTRGLPRQVCGGVLFVLFGVHSLLTAE
jgi:hypothetical protein